MVVEELQILIGCDASTAEKILTELETRLGKFAKQASAALGNTKAIRAVGAAEREQLKTEAARAKYAAQIEKATAQAVIAREKLNKATQATAAAAKKTAEAFKDEERWARLAADSAEEAIARQRAAEEDAAQARIDDEKRMAQRQALWNRTGGKSITEAFREQDTRGFASIEEAIDKMERLQAETDEAGGRFGVFKQKIAEAREKFGEILASVSEIRSKVAAVFSRIGRIISSTFGKAIDAVKKKTHGLVDGFQKMGKAITKILSRMIIWRSINAIVTGTTDGVNNMVQASEKANSAMSQLYSSFIYIKNSVAAMLLPALQSIAPVINRVAQAVANLFNMLGALFAKFRGDSTFTQAVYVQQDYAASLNKSNKAAKELKGTLAGFDQINLIQQQKGGGSGSGIDTSGMFKETTVESMLPTDVSNWIAKLKAAIKAADWNGVGAIIAQGFNTAVRRLDDWIDEIRPRVLQTISNVVESVNSFVQNFNWEDFGRTIINGINLAIQAVATWLKGVKWSDLGEGVGKFINGFIEDWDAESTGDAIEAKIGGVLDFLTNLVETTEWDKVTNKIKEMLQSIDWESIGRKLWELFKAAIGATGSIAEAIFGWDFDRKHTISDTGRTNKYGAKIKKVGSASKQKEEQALTAYSSSAVTEAVEAAGKIQTEFKNASYAVEDFKEKASSSVVAVSDNLGTVSERAESALSSSTWSGANVISSLEEINAKTAETFNKDAWDEKTQTVKSSLGEQWAETSAQWSKDMSEWWTSGVTPWFSEGKWESAMAGIKTAWETIWKGAVNIAIEKINRMIDWLNDKMNIRWDDFKIGEKVIFRGGSLQLFKLNKIPMLADGGIAYGDTLARVGEYANARTNPEVIAPLDKLQSMLGNQKDTQTIISLLKRIAEQDTELALYPSAKLGRIASQSIKMYNATVGAV